MYDFNNSASVLAVLGSIGLFFAAGLACHSPGRGLMLSILRPPGLAREDRVPVKAIAILAALPAISTIYFFFHNSLYYGESTLFIRKMLVALLGRRPYIDFEFGYGPALLYLPLGVDRLGSPLRISVKFSYYVAYAIASCSGVLPLAFSLNCLSIPRGQRFLLFVLISCLAWNETMGIQYTLWRCTLPLACLLLLHGRIVPWVITAGFRRAIGHTLLGAASLACVLTCLAHSSEIGLALLMALISYWAHLAWGQSKGYLLTLVLVVAGCVAFLTAIPHEYFQTLISFGSGSGNFPVLPAFNILLYLFTILYTVPPLLQVSLQDRREPNSALAFGLAVLIVVTIPGALGRCDFGHTFIYGMPPLILTSALLSRQNRRLSLCFLTSFTIGLICLKLAHFLLLYSPQALPMRTIEAFFYHSPTSPGSRAVNLITEAPFHRPSQRNTGKHEDSPPRPARRIGVPLGCGERAFDELVAHGELAHEYYDGFTNLFLKEHLDRKLIDMKSQFVILVPKEDIKRDWANFPFPELDRGFITTLFLYPFDLPARNRLPPPPQQILCRYILRNYKIVNVYKDYFEMVRN